MKIKLLSDNGMEQNNFMISQLLGVEWNWELEDMGWTTERAEWIDNHCELETQLIYTNWSDFRANGREVYQLGVESNTESHYYLILDI